MACQIVYKQGRDDSIKAKVNIKAMPYPYIFSHCVTCSMKEWEGFQGFLSYRNLVGDMETRLECTHNVNVQQQGCTEKTKYNDYIMITVSFKHTKF